MIHHFPQLLPESKTKCFPAIRYFGFFLDPQSRSLCHDTPNGIPPSSSCSKRDADENIANPPLTGMPLSSKEAQKRIALMLHEHEPFYDAGLAKNREILSRLRLMADLRRDNEEAARRDFIAQNTSRDVAIAPTDVTQQVEQESAVLIQCQLTLYLCLHLEKSQWEAQTALDKALGAGIAFSKTVAGEEATIAGWENASLTAANKKAFTPDAAFFKELAPSFSIDYHRVLHAYLPFLFDRQLLFTTDSRLIQVLEQQVAEAKAQSLPLTHEDFETLCVAPQSFLADAATGTQELTGTPPFTLYSTQAQHFFQKNYAITGFTNEHKHDMEKELIFIVPKAVAESSPAFL